MINRAASWRTPQVSMLAFMLVLKLILKVIVLVILELMPHGAYLIVG